MKEQFSEIFKIKDVYGVVLFSGEGKILYEEFKEKKPDNLSVVTDLYALPRTSPNAYEMDVIFSQMRLYIRKVNIGHMIIIMGTNAQMAMVRLTCDMINPTIQSTKQSKGLGRLFKRK
ncbi:MAG: hypothetical protein HKM93_00240 [Desulfobacteraceae bacterium]|nr:hypothetical protein [Desulfobacteraceae bacterium]